MSTTLGCCLCGVEFCLPDKMYDQRLKDHKSFYCPNGHGQVFAGKTAEEKRIEHLLREVDAWRGDWRSVVAELEEAKQRLKVCPFECGFVVKRKQLVETQREAMREHLLLAHGARGHARQLEAGGRQKELSTS